VHIVGCSTMADVFNGLKFANVYELLRFIHTNDLYSTAIRNHTTYYTQTAQAEMFISAVLLIHDSGSDRKEVNTRAINSSGELKSSREIKSFLLERLLENNNEYSYATINFFKRFSYDGSALLYSPHDAERRANSSVRNFLIELDVLELFSDGQTYRLNIDAALLISGSEHSFKFDPSTLQTINELKQKIGEKAELCVMEYERERLKGRKNLSSKIEHVALIDISTGYDILSWEIAHEGEENIPRYIEVKAVSASNNYRFYWSRNEVDAAKKFGGKYYLYLVPRYKFEFDTKNIKVISNPSVEVFGSDRWDAVVESYSVCKIK